MTPAALETLNVLKDVLEDGRGQRLPNGPAPSGEQSDPRIGEWALSDCVIHGVTDRARGADDAGLSKKLRDGLSERKGRTVVDAPLGLIRSCGH